MSSTNYPEGTVLFLPILADKNGTEMVFVYLSYYLQTYSLVKRS
jgi:hypothetical protein